MERIVPAWRTAIAEYIRREAQPADKYGHQPRLYALTLKVGEGQTYDDDVVFAAAWMHDLGVFYGHRPEDPIALAGWDNVAYAMERAPRLLAEFGFPKEKIPAVVAAISSHQVHGDPKTVEATVLRDADLLEQLGAIGILRAVAKVGRDTRFLTFTGIVPYMRKALDIVPGQLRLPSARLLAEPRIEAMKEFLAAVEAEAQGNLY